MCHAELSNIRGLSYSLALPLIAHVILNKSRNFSELQFSHLENKKAVSQIHFRANVLLTRFCDLKLWLLGINRWVDSKAQRLNLFMLPIILV